MLDVELVDPEPEERQSLREFMDASVFLSQPFLALRKLEDAQEQIVTSGAWGSSSAGASVDRSAVDHPTKKVKWSGLYMTGMMGDELVDEIATFGESVGTEGELYHDHDEQGSDVDGGAPDGGGAAGGAPPLGTAATPLHTLLQDHETTVSLSLTNRFYPLLCTAFLCSDRFTPEKVVALDALRCLLLCVKQTGIGRTSEVLLRQDLLRVVRTGLEGGSTQSGKTLDARERAFFLLLPAMTSLGAEWRDFALGVSKRTLSIFPYSWVEEGLARSGVAGGGALSSRNGGGAAATSENEERKETPERTTSEVVSGTSGEQVVTAQFPRATGSSSSFAASVGSLNTDDGPALTQSERVVRTQKAAAALWSLAQIALSEVKRTESRPPNNSRESRERRRSFFSDYKRTESSTEFKI